MIASLFGWLGVITPEKRAKSEVESLDRLIYDAHKNLQSASAQLDYLQERRDFLIQEYDMAEHPPSSRRVVHQVSQPLCKSVPQSATASMGPSDLEWLFNRGSRH